MIVLRILGIVLCVVLLLGVSLTVFTLFAPARIEIKRDMPDGQLKMRLGFGPIKKVFRLGGKKKKADQEARKKRTTRETKEKTTAPRFDLKRLPIDRALELVAELIYDLAGAIVWERLHVTVILHTADAARTGRLLGACSAVVGNLYPYLEQTHVLKDTKIVIDADFDAQKTIWGEHLCDDTAPVVSEYFVEAAQGAVGTVEGSPPDERRTKIMESKSNGFSATSIINYPKERGNFKWQNMV